MVSTAPLGPMPKVPPDGVERRPQTHPECLQKRYSQLHVSIPASWTQDLHDTTSHGHSAISYLPGHVARTVIPVCIEGEENRNRTALAQVQ